MIKDLLLTTSGMLGLWRLTRRLTRNAPRIFMFHRFSAGSSSAGTSGAELRMLLEMVARECDLVCVADLVERIRDRTTGNRPLAAITVDDGYADFHAVALPVLRELRVPATVYATAGFIDRRCWLWWDALRYLLDEHPDGEIQVRIGRKPLLVRLNGPDSRHQAWNRIADRLVRCNAERMQVLAEIESSGGIALPEAPTPSYEAMTWEQLAEAQASGIEIGGHTMNHPFLPGLDEAALHEEVGGAKVLLESRLRSRIRTFAYPNGMPYDRTDAVEAAVRAAGFDAAVLACPVAFDPDHLYALGRWSVRPGVPMLGHVLSGASELKLRLHR